MADEENLFSKPILSQNSSVLIDVVEYSHSFGYDCKRMFNLLVMESNVVVFASGNLIHFFNVDTLEVTTRRSTSGGGIGCIKKNPKHPHLVVAENGNFPPIFIYNYPDMKVIAHLKKGTTFTFSCLDFSPDGELLLSQGGDPDYLLTVWRWSKQEVVLKVKSFHNDVLNLMFSPTVSGQMTTCGFGHIKFWKMSQTFTGLKLQGEVGRFGKTEISDIIGIYPMPDEKVLSGCEWGNILVWEHGLISLEVKRKGKRRLHNGPITQIFAREGEIITIGIDGWARVWFWETVELADPPEHSRFVEIEPIYEYQIGGMSYNSELLSMQRVDMESQKYYLQDGNGGLWLCDISPVDTKDPPKQFFKCHSGPIFTICASPVSPHVATLGRDGRLFMYNYETKKVLFCHQFISQGDDMIWLPVTIDSSGIVIILAFDDGVIRLVSVDLDESKPKESRVQLIQVLKSHSEPIRKLTINARETLLVSGGDDNMIFVHQISKETNPSSPFVTLIPIGLVITPSPVTFLSWKPSTFTTILVGCKFGEVMEADLPEEPVDYTNISFRLTHVKPRTLKFKSKKGEILREKKIYEAEKKKTEKLERKREELNRILAENPGANINEETFLEDSETEEEIEPAYVPKIPNRVLWVQYTINDTLWLSMSGFDAGYVYEYSFDHEEPLNCTPISNAENIEINSYLYFDKYLIFGMGDGSLRINNVQHDFTDLSNYWILNMHDNRYGNVNCMAFSYDRKYLFTGGADGNFFSYKWNKEVPDVLSPIPTKVTTVIEEAEDIDDICYLSLEEEKQKQDHDRRMEIALSRKSEVIKVIAKCKEEYESLIKRNKALPASQRIPWTELELDPRITDSLQKRFDDEMNLVKQKKAFDVEKVTIAGKKLKEYFLDPLDSIPIEVLAIKEDKSAKSFRMHKLDKEFFESKKDLEIRIERDLERQRLIESVEEKEVKQEEERREKLESFLQGLTESDVDLRLDTKCRRLLRKYRARKSKEAARTKEWDELNAQKPEDGVNHPDDDKELFQAEKTIGDYKLKISPNFDPIEENRDTTLKKFKELIEVREKIYNIRKSFNDKVFALREKKVEVFKYVEIKKRSLNEVHKEILEEQRKDPDITVEFNVDVEYPEKAFEVETYMGVNPSLSELFLSQLPPWIPDTLSDIQREILSAKLPEGEQHTPWEIEMIEFRRQSMLYEQDRLIDRINERIKEFNEKVSKLAEERLQVELEAKFLEQYLLTLNQELWVLKDFEQLEEQLVIRLEQQIFDRNKIFSDMMNEKTIVRTKKKHIAELEEKQNDIEAQFTLKCRDNPYWKYFRKIFYKKWKPPKIVNEDEDHEYETESDDSEQSELYPSSNENDENEQKPASPIDINYKTLNENNCPDDCDEELFKLAHESRKRYHLCQSEIVGDEAKVLLSTETAEKYAQKLASLKIDLEKTKKELLEFRRKKQKFLNTIETLVVLKMDQLQYFKDAEQIDKVEDTLLFSNNNIMKLYARVGQLALETLEVKRKHRVNVVHLSRIKADIKFMEQQISDLKEEINSAMTKKFGRVVDLDELEEAILRRYVFELRTNKDDVKKEYSKKIAKAKRELAAKEEELAKTIQEGIEKLNILTILQEEKNYISHALFLQNMLEDQAKKKVRIDYKKDVLRLREIARHQHEQIIALQKDIRGMSFKCRPSLGTPTLQPKTPEKRASSPPQPFRQRVFEDSVYQSIVESRADSSKCSTPNLELFREMGRIVKMFFVKSLRKQADCHQIQTITCTLARYLTNIATSFTPETADKLLPEIIDNFQSFIPPEILTQIPKADIAKLIEDIVGSFREEFDIEPKDVIQEIIAVSCEGLAKGHEKYSELLLTEILKQMVVTMRVNDLKDEMRLKEVGTELKKRGFVYCGINANDVVVEVAKYAAENYLDDVDFKMIQSIIDKIIKYYQHD